MALHPVNELLIKLLWNLNHRIMPSVFKEDESVIWNNILNFIIQKIGASIIIPTGNN